MLPQYKPINEDYTGGDMPMRRSTSSDYRPGESARLDETLIGYPSVGYPSAGYPSASLGAFGGYNSAANDRAASSPSSFGNNLTAPMPSMSEPNVSGMPFGFSAPTVASAGAGVAANLAGLGGLSGPIGALAGYAAGNSGGKSLAQGVGSIAGTFLGGGFGSAILGYLAGQAFDYFSPKDQPIVEMPNAFPAIETFDLAAPQPNPDALAYDGGGMFGGESGPEGYGGDPDGHR